MISSDSKEITNTLIEVCDGLENIASKELSEELPTNEEFDFIREYGYDLEKIWKYYVYEKGGVKYSDTEDYPNYLVVDIATDNQNATCLELGTGRPMLIYVAVKFDDQIRIARGITYSFYEFEMPIANRLTDQEWQKVVIANNRDTLPPLALWCEDYCVKNSDYKGTTYKGFQGVLNEIDRNMIEIQATIKKRDYPSTTTGKHIGAVHKGEKYKFSNIVENEGYTWYQIESTDIGNSGGWIADDGTWIKKLSIENEEPKWKADYHHIRILDTVPVRYYKDGEYTNLFLRAGEEYLATINTYNSTTRYVIGSSIVIDEITTSRGTLAYLEMDEASNYVVDNRFIDSANRIEVID